MRHRDVRQSETALVLSAPRSCAKDGRCPRGRPRVNSESRAFIYRAPTERARFTRLRAGRSDAVSTASIIRYILRNIADTFARSCFVTGSNELCGSIWGIGSVCSRLHVQLKYLCEQDLITFLYIIG